MPKRSLKSVAETAPTRMSKWFYMTNHLDKTVPVSYCVSLPTTMPLHFVDFCPSAPENVQVLPDFVQVVSVFVQVVCQIEWRFVQVVFRENVQVVF